jgi:hypothetical protein
MPNRGDGSGSGAGGTLGWRGTLGFAANPLQMWMGHWAPIVYAGSSNWKAVMTLKLTLQNIAQIDPDQAPGTTILYFTDNYATYCVAASGSSPSPRLYSLIKEIRLLELRLECALQVVHVPGVVVITEGTDGLGLTRLAVGLDGGCLCLALIRWVSRDLSSP